MGYKTDDYNEEILGNRTECRPIIRWETFRPTNGRKVARLPCLSFSQSCLSLSLSFSFSLSLSLSLSLLFPTLSLFQFCSISLQHCLSPTHISFSLFHQAYLSLRHSHKEKGLIIAPLFAKVAP